MTLQTPITIIARDRAGKEYEMASDVDTCLLISGCQDLFGVETLKSTAITPEREPFSGDATSVLAAALTTLVSEYGIAAIRVLDHLRQQWDAGIGHFSISERPPPPPQEDE